MGVNDNGLHPFDLYFEKKNINRMTPHSVYILKKYIYKLERCHPNDNRMTFHPVYIFFKCKSNGVLSGYYFILQMTMR